MKCVLFAPILVLSMLSADMKESPKEALKNPLEVNSSDEKIVIISDNIMRGRTIFMKKIKSSCGMNGVEFATKHTQDEWEMIRNLGAFKLEAQKICPSIRELNARLIADLYEFIFEYAKDSGNVPSCAEEDIFEIE